jgi:hypothetical protein
VNKKKVIPYSMITGGALITLTGLWLASMYIYYAVIDRIGEGDQSLLFWYLPLLLGGIIAIIIGIGIGLFGRDYLPKSRKQESECNQ